MSTSSILVVGSNRGIGLGLVEETLKRDASVKVFATARDIAAAKDLIALTQLHPGRLVLLNLDILNEASITAAVTELTKHTASLESIIINAGVLLGQGKIEDLQAASLLQNLNANVVGPHNVTKAFSPFLIASKAEKRTLAYISSIGGSVTLAQGINTFLKNMYEVDYASLSGYASTKTALNMLGRQWADSLEPLGIAVPLIHPGAVKTDMNPTGDGLITVLESATGVLDVLATLKIEDTPKGILSYDGSIAPW